MTQTTPPAPAITRRAWLGFAVVCSIQLMIVVDISIVTVALRSIQSDLGFEQAQIAWVTNAYTVGFGGLLLLSGRLGDLIGRRNVFLIGLIGFTVASALCGFAQNQAMLIGFRFLQGAAAAMAYAMVMGIAVTLFADPRQIGKAMGTLGFVQAAGASVGILAGGVLTQGISWHWIFFINVPIGIAATVLAVRLLPLDRGIGLRAGADVVGAVLVTAGLMLGVYAIATVGDHGWGSARTLGLGGTAIVLLIAFVAREATTSTPLMPLSLFRNRNVAGGNLVHLLMVAGVISFNILIALFLQQVLGYEPLVTSLAYLPIAISAGIVSIGVSARLNMRFGLRNVLLGGLVLVAAGLLLAVRIPVDANYAIDLLPVMLLMGIGGGLTMPAVMMLSMSVTRPQDAGLASGVAGTSGMIGDSLGLAALTAIAAAHTVSLINNGSDPTSALNDGFHLAFGISAGLIVVAMIVGAVLLRTPAGPPMGPPPEGPPSENPAAPGVPSGEPADTFRA
ncbi:MFS transporter [Actinoplanes sp. NPDC023936]|uniref:MFS transporter n=1 Tax=Actinoplanes sp. NPDC023936 TaxID=3154910 RepID=UPI0033C036E2